MSILKERGLFPYHEQYHLPLLLRRGAEGPDTTMPEMKAIRKMTTNLSDCLCILLLVIVAVQPQVVSGGTEAGMWRSARARRRNGELCLSVALASD